LREAARLANIDQLIEKLPLGYETVVGERGLRFSGGQAQRVALARAFLRQPRILVLDEATAALDWVADRQVQRALAQLMRDRTTIMITHKMFMVQEMDNILVLDGNRVVQEGRHEALISQEGLYQELYHQVQGEAERAAMRPSGGPPRGVVR